MSHDPGLGRIHFIGVGGAGVSGLARLYHDLGATVSGSDQADSPLLDALAAAGLRVWAGHDAARMNLAGRPDTVVYSSAVPPDDIELAAARAGGARLWRRATALARLAKGRRTVAVAGSHGKTTTTAMVVAALTAAGRDPGFVIGATLASDGRGAAWGRDREFVIEADESDGSFLEYPAEIAVITTIDADHLDHWGTVEAYRAGFESFATGPAVRLVVAGADDPGAAWLADRLRAQGRPVVTYGQAPGADWRLSRPSLDGLRPSAQLTTADWSGRLQLAVPGIHNLANAAAAVAVGAALGADPAALTAGLADFPGTERRFQPRGQAGGVTVFDDYAHHPTELRATLAAARTVTRGRVVVAFQPHLFSRTRDFADGFGAALAQADQVVVSDVYPAREQPLPGVSGALVAQAVADHGGQVVYVERLGDLALALAGLARPGDLVLLAGAGSITTVADDLLARLAAGRPEAL
ncbi:MAG: UDP-N-acetylmuramate--L-alanine ligase [Propionibacteriaceae bacterium]|jgi:UDP-N-acetylmuramate--alanine ligase|nr:UDP-N-acetylmuramate--L-alanine ligase [Propionibacteriaceae bacterium]